MNCLSKVHVLPMYLNSSLIPRPSSPTFSFMKGRKESCFFLSCLLVPDCTCPKKREKKFQHLETPPTPHPRIAVRTNITTHQGSLGDTESTVSSTDYWYCLRLNHPLPSYLVSLSTLCNTLWDPSPDQYARTAPEKFRLL